MMSTSSYQFLMVMLVYLHGYEDDPEVGELKIMSFIDTINDAKNGDRVFGNDDNANFIIATTPDKLVTNFLEGYMKATREKYDMKTGQRKMKEKLIAILTRELNTDEETLLQQCSRAKGIADLMIHGIHIDTTNDTGGETNG